MKSPSKSVEAVKIILEYVELQTHLLSEFWQLYPNFKNANSLFNFPSAGYIVAQDEKWEFQRHGKGMCFTATQSEKIVDIHVGLREYPQAFDAWRIVQYIESIHLEHISYLSDTFDINNKLYNEDIIEELLHILWEDDLVEFALEPRKLYRLKDIA